MSDRKFFPPLRVEFFINFETAVRGFQDDPAYFDDPRCPYDEKQRVLIQAAAGAITARTSREINLDELVSDPEALGKEIQGAYQKIVDVMDNLDELPLKDQVTVLGVASRVLEKLSGMLEQNLNHREFLRFKATIVGIMEDILSPEQRTEFLERLDEVSK